MGKDSGSETQTVKNELDPFLKSKMQEYWNIARPISQQPYQHYDGPRIAPFNEYQTQANQMLLNSGADLYGRDLGYNAAINVANNFQAPQIGYDFDRIQERMDPYANDVVNRMAYEVQRSGDQANTTLGAGAATGGAYGGARHALMEMEQNRNTQDVIANNTAGIMSNAYNQAYGRDMQEQMANQQAAFGEANTILNAAKGAGAATMMEGQADSAAAGNFMNVGQMYQGMDQANLDMAYNDFLRQFAYPRDWEMNTMAQALGMMSGGGTQTTTGPAQQSGGLLGAVGGAASGAGIASALSLTGPWGWGLAGLGALAGL